jgi:hypothetical protein
MPIALAIVLLVYIFRRELLRVGRYFQSWKQSDELEDQMSIAARQELDGQGDEDQGDDELKAKVGNGKA